MRRRLWVWIVGLLAITPLIAEAQILGHIQVKAASGIQIFLDGDLKGLTTAEVGGLIIQNVPPGAHRLKAFKSGFQPQETLVTVRRNEVLVYTVKPLVPKVEIAEKGDEQADQLKLRVGTLVVHSLPVECVIDIPSLGIRAVQKTKDQWTASRVPEGSHPATFRGLGKTLQHTFVIRAGETRKVMVNFIEARITDIALEERQAEGNRRAAVQVVETLMAAHARAVYGLPDSQQVAFRVNGRCEFSVTEDYIYHGDRSRHRETHRVNVRGLDPTAVRLWGSGGNVSRLHMVFFTVREGNLITNENCMAGRCRPSEATEGFVAVDDEDVARRIAEALRTWIGECQQED